MTEQNIIVETYTIPKLLGIKELSKELAQSQNKTDFIPKLEV